MKALVTGGTGFVGSHLVRALNDAGHEVRVLHRKSSRLIALEGCDYESVIGDVTDFDALMSACEGVDWVFHVAAVADYWRADKSWMFDVNVEGTRKVLRAAKEANVQRVIFTSSAAALGFFEDRTTTETDDFNLSPDDFPYGYSKSLAEKVVAEFVADGLDVVIVNPAVIIGPADLNLISGNFIVKTAQLQWLTPMTHGGIGVIDVRDVAMMHLKAAEKGRTGERYILSHENYKYGEWFKMIADAVGVSRPLFYSPSWMVEPTANLTRFLRHRGISVPVDENQIRLGARHVWFDSSKAHTELYQPQIPMAQSVAETFVWYEEHDYIKRNVFTKIIGAIGGLFKRS